MEPANKIAKLDSRFHSPNSFWFNTGTESLPGKYEYSPRSHVVYEQLLGKHDYPPGSHVEYNVHTRVKAFEDTTS